MSKIFVTSDLHLGHNKDFIYKPRGFSSVEEHDETIISNWNNTVSESNEVYVLGDLTFNNNENKLFLLNGKIHVIKGNHDTKNKIREYLKNPNIVEITDAKRIKYNKHHFYLSHYPTLTSNFDTNKDNIEINLCGHLHTKNKFYDIEKGYIYHVELDAHNCFPILLDTVIEDLKGLYFYES